MKRQNRFIIALLAAGITFATLTATVGTEHWKRGHYFHHGYYHHYDHDDHSQDRDQDNWNGKEPEEDTSDNGSGT